jgi:misacylated tRNA(Ala) deacylase
MTRYFCHDNPDVFALETRVRASRPDAVLLETSPFYPGGGGQLPDRGTIAWSGGEAEVTGFETHADGSVWHLVEGAPPEGDVLAKVDRPFRDLMSELHTVSHIVNALVFQDFGGALVTGVQMAADGTFRIDFDLPGADNDKLKALEPQINSAIRQDFPVRQVFLPWDIAEKEPGLLRSKAVTPPPQSDGTVRIIDIVGLDRQACGGTHLRHTGQSRSVRILKIDNKGRQNRRLRVGLDGMM